MIEIKNYSIGFNGKELLTGCNSAFHSGTLTALIANYVYDLVKSYNQFYHDCSILKETDSAVRSLRLELSRQTARVIKSGMNLLGINVPERM